MTKRGYTLTEIMIAVGVAAFMATLALPRYGTFVNKMKSQEAQAILFAVLTDQLAYYKENGSYANSMASLSVQVPTPKNFDDVQAGSVTLTCSGNSRATVANMQFKDTSFTLYVTTDGQIVCVKGGGSDPCPSLGYLSCS